MTAAIFWLRLHVWHIEEDEGGKAGARGQTGPPQGARWGIRVHGLGLARQPPKRGRVLGIPPDQRQIWAAPQCSRVIA